MRTWFMVLVCIVVMATACGGSDDSADDDGSVGTQSPTTGQQDATNDTGSNAGAGSSSGDGGTLESPTPEASGPLPSDGFRIGKDVWVRTIPITSGQCFVQEGEGIDPFAVWGTLNGDDNLSFAVSYAEGGSFSSEVTSDSMFWAAGEKIGSELTVEHDFATQSISGDGLFYNLHSDEWAYASFQFTCTGE